MAEQPTTVSQVVAHVIESMSNNISDLMVIVIGYQEQNTAPPTHLPNSVGSATQAANVLADVANTLATSEYAEYPDIAKRITDGAQEVITSNDNLNKALKTLMTSPDRVAGWEGLVSGFKNILGETIKLLQIVYGAQRERVFRAAEKALESLASVNPDDIDSVPKDFVDAVSKAATNASQLAELLRVKAEDTESPMQKQKLQEMSKNLVNQANQLIQDCNALIKNPKDRNLRDKVVQDLGELNGTIDSAIALLNEMDHEFDDAHSRFEDMSRDMERSLEELEKAKLATYADDILVTAAKEKDGMKFLEEDLEEEDAEGAQRNLDYVAKQNARLVKLAEMESAATTDATKRAQLKKLAGELEQAQAAYAVVGKRAVGNVSDTGARAQLKQKSQVLQAKIKELENIVRNPGAEIRAIARKEVEDLAGLQNGAIDQDPKAVSRSAKAVVELNKNLLALARKQAGRTEDPVRRKQILDECDELERLLPHNIMATKAVMENPDDEDARNYLAKRTAAMQKHVMALAENACPYPEIELLEAIQLDRKLVAEMKQAAESGDKAGVQAVAPRITNNTKRIDELAKQVVTKFDDRARKARLIDALKKLDVATGSTISDSGSLASNSSNPTQRSRVDKGVAEINKQLDAILDETEVELFAESLKQKADMHDMENALLEGDKKTAAQKATAIAKRQANLAAMARASARRTEDPLRRKQMLDDVDELEMFMPDAIFAAGKALDSPDDNGNNQRLADSMMMMDSLLGGIMNPDDYNADLRRRGKGSGQEGMGGELLSLNALMPELLAASENLAKNPSDANRSKMQELLENLDLHELDSDEAKLGHLIHEQNVALNDLTVAAEAGDKKATADAQKRLQDIQGKLSAHARALASKTEDALKRKRMMEAVDELDMLFPMVSNAAGAVVNDPSNVQKRQELRNLVRRVHNNTDVLSALGNAPPEMQIHSLSELHKEALERLRAAVKAHDTGGAKNAFGDVQSRTTALCEVVRNFATTDMKDPVLSKRVLGNVAALEQLIPNLGASSMKAAQTRGNAQLQAKANGEIDQAKALINAILADTRASPIAICQEEDMILQQLSGHINANSAAAAEDFQDFQKVHAIMKQRVMAAVEKMKNPNNQRSIKASIAAMDQMLPHHIKAAQAVLQHPTNNQAKDQFANTNLRMRAPLAGIIAALRPSPANVMDMQRRREGVLLAELRAACARGDEPGSEKLLSDIAPINERIVTQARAFAEKCPDARAGKEVSEAAEKLEQLHSNLASIAREARANPRNAMLQEKLASHTAQMEACMDTIVTVMRTPVNAAQDKARRLLNTLMMGTKSGRIDSARFLGAASDLAQYINGLGGAGGDINAQLAALSQYENMPDVKRKVAGGDVDSLLSFLADMISGGDFQPKTWDEMIQKVANDVKRAAGSDDSDPVMRGTRLVGLELAKIAKAAKMGDRKGMIEAGKEANAAINQLIAVLRPMADRCSDPVTRDRLLRTIQAMKNYSTQLKILCAVKAGAAIGEQDADTQGQLVAVTKSLGKTLTESISTVKTMRNARFI